MDKNIQSWDNSANSSYSNFDYLVDGRNIRNLLSDKTFLVRDSKRKRKSYSISCISENTIVELELKAKILEIDNQLSEIMRNQQINQIKQNNKNNKNNYSFLNEHEPESFFSFSKNSSYLKNGSKSNNNDDYIYDIKSNWNNNLNSFIESYLSSQICIDWNNNLNSFIESYPSSQICIDSYILDDSVEYNHSDFTIGKVSNSGESESTSIITSTNDTNDINPIYLEISNNMAKYKHLWVRCEDCYELNYKKFLKSRMNLCEHCGSHLKMSSSDRIELLIDPGTWNPMDEYMVSVDPIEFHSEEEPYKIDSYQKKTGLKEAIQTGTGQLNGIPLAIGIMEFEFMGGSMGSVVGEKITRLIEYATNQRLPLILVCASGGARMQEGSLSLMQMAKISSALYDYQINQKLFYVPILTSPTTGGVTASFGMLGDIIIAEPNAYIAFAGKRVIEQTLNKEVPEGSQSAEFLFDKGLFDSIVPRNLLKAVLTELFQLHGFVPLTPNEK
uniref:Acetyl-coenzyme A carboxylase carboxyl transferase subunit beta n=1 Tax=Astragalus acutirostris TaxID=457880 RepID=A0A8K1N236_9FABA|nr:acetyl-CoA carboxylase carboxyltransferase beta subunit [Astragalus acutirostris]UCS39908.1 acetyl-CoA carboxylase carboxyltransferase beta subunit [Astragalus acutirostris]